MLNSFISTIQEEWRVMLKQKMILIVIIVIPLLVNFLIGWEFSSNQIKHIPMAVCDQDNSSLSRMIVQQFVENEQFDVRFFLNDSLEMKRLLDDSSVRVGMIIPRDFYKDVVELKSPRILMLYDGSHMPVASAAKSRASEILLTLKTGMLIKLIQGKLNLPEAAAQKLALTLQFKNRTLFNPAKSFKNFLNPGLITGLIQAAIALVTATAVRKQELPEGKKQRAGYILGKLAFYSLLGMMSLLGSIMIQNKIFDIPFRGKLLHAAILSFALAAAVASFGLMAAVWVRDKILATQVCAVLFIPNTVMVGYTWPILAMPRPYQIAAEFLPFYHYADNLRDMFLKGFSLSYMLYDIIWFGGFILITLVIALVGLLFLKDYNTGVNTLLGGRGGQNVIH